MLPSFRSSLEQYHRLAKDTASPTLSETERERLSHVLDWQTETYSKETGTGPDVQRAIFNLQQTKERLMRELKTLLKAIQNDERVGAENPNTLPVEMVDGKLMTTWKETSHEITLGQLVGDLTWGKTYTLDPVSVPKVVRKRYVFEQMKAKLWDAMEEQIRLQEDNRNIDPSIAKGAFRGGIMHKSSEDRGFLSERVAFTFMKQLEIDQGIDVKIEQADLYHDLVQAIDMLVVVPDWTRGVRVESGENASVQVQGVQLYSPLKQRPNLRSIRQKQQRISGVMAGRRSDSGFDDIQLVVLPGKHIEQAYQAWKRDGQPPGGPTPYLTPEQQHHTVTACLGGLIDPAYLATILEQLPKIPPPEVKPISPRLDQQERTVAERTKLRIDPISSFETRIAPLDARFRELLKIPVEVDSVALTEAYQKQMRGYLEALGSVLRVGEATHQRLIAEGDAKNAARLEDQLRGQQRRYKLIEEHLPRIRFTS